VRVLVKSVGSVEVAPRDCRVAGAKFSAEGRPLNARAQMLATFLDLDADDHWTLEALIEGMAPTGPMFTRNRKDLWQS